MKPEDIKAIEEASKLLDGSGKRATPQMPVYGKLPELSPKEKAARQKELDAKIKANQPASKPTTKPTSPRHTGDVRSIPKTPPPPVRPTPGPVPGSALPQPASKPSSMPMEQVEIDKANKLAATPKTYMPQANTVPNAAMAAQQKMPPPNMVPPANARPMAPTPGGAPAMKRGGSVRNKPAAKFSSGGSTSKASSRGDGIAQRGKTKGRYI